MERVCTAWHVCARNGAEEPLATAEHPRRPRTCPYVDVLVGHVVADEREGRVVLVLDTGVHHADGQQRAGLGCGGAAASGGWRGAGRGVVATRGGVVAGIML